MNLQHAGDADCERHLIARPQNGAGAILAAHPGKYKRVDCLFSWDKAQAIFKTLLTPRDAHP